MKRIDLSLADHIYDEVKTAADSCGLSPLNWVRMIIAREVNARAPTAKADAKPDKPKAPGRPPKPKSRASTGGAEDLSAYRLYIDDDVRQMMGEETARILTGE